MDITKQEAQEWIDENKDVTYLGHGMSDRHEMIMRLMLKKVAEGDE